MSNNDCHLFRAAESAAMHAAAIRANDRSLADFFARICQSNQSGSPYKPGDRLSAIGGKTRAARP
jgi:hypothetical protein